MIPAPAIALYLGESYASLGAFDLSEKEIFEKSVFLPQVSFKNLLTQTKLKILEHLGVEDFSEHPIRFFIVTKYLDRLRHFRLGGSVTQVVQSGFENSYALANTKSLSLAAASLVISVNPETLTEEFLVSELARIKKINSDSNKVVIQLSESKFTTARRELVQSFFTAAEFNIFTCKNPERLGEVRKTLLNAGTEGTKEEVVSEIKEIFGDNCEASFWIGDKFTQSFENHELFGSSSSFLASLAAAEQSEAVAYFDHECFRLIQAHVCSSWKSPWGKIPTPHFEAKELHPHPFAEVRLDHMSMLGISKQQTQHEPGPVCAGRGIKPLVLDLFSEEVGQLPVMKSLFVNFSSDAQKQKLENHLSVIEKGQAENSLKTTRTEIKEQIIEGIKNELSGISKNQKLKVTGPLAPIFGFKNAKFDWPKEIIKKALV